MIYIDIVFLASKRSYSAYLVHIDQTNADQEAKNRMKMKHIKTMNKNYQLENTKLIYASFLKDMRDLSSNRNNSKLTRHKSQNHIDNDPTAASMRRCDSLSRMLETLSKNCEREHSCENK